MGSQEFVFECAEHNDAAARRHLATAITLACSERTRNLDIREATVDDSESISNLIYALSTKYIAHEFTVEGAKTLLNSMQPDAIRKYIQSNYRYHVVEIDGQIVGVVGVKDNCHLYHLFVADEYQRQGIARKLWQVALEECVSKGNTGKFTVNSSKHALSAYEKLGFVIRSEPEERNGVVCIPMTTGYRHGRWMTINLFSTHVC